MESTTDNVRSQMRKGVLEYCILCILSKQEAYASSIIDALHDFLATRLAQIMGFQAIQILFDRRSGVLLEREGIASDAQFLNLFHRLSA